jgi:hypothetical protein
VTTYSINLYIFKPTMQDAGEKSEYELLREANIRRNKEVMAALGLDDSDFQLHALHKKKSDKGSSSSSSSGSSSGAAKRKRPEKGTTEPSRRSSRVAGLEAEAAAEGGLDGDRADGEEGGGGGSKRFHADLHASEEEHAAAEEAYLRRWAGKQGRVTIVGTASYAHTLMRVRTMSEAALGKRVKAIERAAGKHAVVKMRLFARVLCLEGYEELAADATDALKRLVELLGDPEEEEAAAAAAAGETGEEGEGGQQEEETKESAAQGG